MIKALEALARLRSSRLGLLEQLIGGAAVTRGIGHVGFDALDFGLQGFNPSLELVDRQRPKVLLGDLRQRVLRPAGEEVVLVHRIQR